MESLLKRIFDFGVAQNNKYACHWVADEQHWYVCPCVIYVTPDNSEDTEVQAYKGGTVPDKLKSNPSLAYPENMFRLLLEDLPADFVDFFCTDSVVYSFKSGKSIAVDNNLPFRRYSTLNPTIKTHWNELKVSLGVGGSLPMLQVSDGQETAWVVCAFNAHPEELELVIDGQKLIPCDWSDKDKCYKKLRKEKKMAKMQSFDDLVKGTLGVTPAEVQPKDPEKAGKENPMEAPKVEQANQTAVQQPQEAPKEITPAESTEVKEPVKRTRKKAETTPLTDLTKVIEQLSGAIPEKMTSDDALKAIRQLRDLQLAAARRAANISLQYIESTEGAVAKLEAIKAQL